MKAVEEFSIDGVARMKCFKKEVVVLGQVYKVSYKKKVKYCQQYSCSGVTDGVEKTIKVQKSDSPEYDMKVLRHEVLHAFAFESGFFGSQHVRPMDETHDEQVIDWMAVQAPKIIAVWEELGCI